MAHTVQLLTRVFQQALPDGQKVDVPFSYKEAITSTMQPRSDESMDITGVRRGLRILDLVESLEDGESFDIEDADYEYLLGRVKATRWRAVNRVIVQFVEDMETAPKAGAADPGSSDPKAPIRLNRAQQRGRTS